METLKISLFGSFEARIGERPLTRFRTQKLQALLIYLAVEKEKTHRRETLMGLLWPDLPQKSARDTLRQTLSLLRKAIPAQTDSDNQEVPFLISDRQTVQIHPSYPLTLDVHQFLAWHETGQRQNDAILLQQAVDLLQGDFLTDFYVADSSSFEGWVEMQRGRLQRLGLEGMATLTAVALSQHQFSQAERIARRQLEIDDLREGAHRQLMRALAQNGRRHEALAQYDSLHKLLWDELGIAPEAATQTLLTQIEAGELASPQPVEPVRLTQPEANAPLFLTLSALTPPSEHDAFVARTTELAQLHARLNEAIKGQMGVVFVTGEAGQGKSALLQAFMKQAIEQHETLLAADGTCSAVIGTGDPYHPMRQWMSMLTGDLESKWGLGTISSKWARHLWSAADAVVDAVLTHGPNLLGTLVPTAPIAARLKDHLPIPQNEPLSQPALFAQVTAVLQALTQQSPLLLVLDDMQWADSGTISLLFHLGRQLRHAPILLLCAYRPSDVAAGRLGERHPLESVLAELGRLAVGETAVSLENADHHAFVEAVIDSQPNQLDSQFRQRLYEQTGGHPLFTVELLREMRQRRDLRLDDAIQWTTVGDLDWNSLPSRVESAVAERIDRLPAHLRDLLKVACVEGETFTAEVLAQVQELSARELVQSLSSQLDQQHRLIEVVGIDRLGGQRLSRYRFRHHLIYQYLQTQLDAVETVYLHEAVADALLTLAGDETHVVAVQLAHHYEQASLLEKAFRYQQQAGDEARRLSARDEAQAHTQHALTLLAQLPPSPDRVPQRLKLQTAVLRPKIRQYGFGAGDVVATLLQINEEQDATHLPTLFGLAMGALWAGNGLPPRKGESRLAAQWSQKLTQAVTANDATGQLAAHAIAANLALLQDEFEAAEARFQQALAAADDVDRTELVANYGLDVGAICEMRLAVVADLLERRGEARETAVSLLTHPNSHPPTQAHILHDAAWLGVRWGETAVVTERVKSLNALAYEHDMRHWQAIGSVLMGWLLIQRGHIEDGTAQMEEGKAECAKLNCQLWFDLE